MVLGRAMTSERKWIRIGIALEETGTHVVALDDETLEWVAAHKESAREEDAPASGLAWRARAEEIRRALHALLSKGGFPPERVLHLSFSTIRSVNAALQARPSLVGLIDFDSSPSGRTAREAELIALPTGHLVRVARLTLRAQDLERVSAWLDPLYALRARGAEGFVINPAGERSPRHAEWTLLECHARLGVPLCSLSEFSRESDELLRLRAAVSLVTALAETFLTAEVILKSARRLGLRAPLFVVRNDGGLIPWEHLRHRPTLGFLSGPVAGIQGSLSHANLSDGILLQAGLSSSHIAVVQQGHPREGEVELAQMRLPLQALAVFSIPIGSESLLSFRRGAIASVGPWSAATLGLRAARHASPEVLTGARLHSLRLVPGQAEEVLILLTRDGHSYALTVGEAAACLRLFASEDPEKRQETARKALEPLAARLALSPEDVAELILERAAQALAQTIHRALRRSAVTSPLPLVGMGASAPLFLPLLSRRLGLPSLLLEQSEWMGAFGAAAADLHETIECSLTHASEKELARVRDQVERTLLAWGAARSSLTVQLREDSTAQRVYLRATGRVSPHPERSSPQVTPDQRLSLAATILALPEEQVELVAETEAFEIYRGRASRRRFLRRRETPMTKMCLCSKSGDFVLPLEEAMLTIATVGDVAHVLPSLMERATEPPARLYLLAAFQAIDLSHAASEEQALRWAERALLGLPATEPVFVICGHHRE